MTALKLGQGSFAVVKECRLKKSTDLFAAKVIRKGAGLNRDKVGFAWHANGLAAS